MVEKRHKKLQKTLSFTIFYFTVCYRCCEIRVSRLWSPSLPRKARAKSANQEKKSSEAALDLCERAALKSRIAPHRWERVSERTIKHSACIIDAFKLRRSQRSGEQWGALHSTSSFVLVTHHQKTSRRQPAAAPLYLHIYYIKHARHWFLLSNLVPSHLPLAAFSSFAVAPSWNATLSFRAQADVSPDTLTVTH